MRLRIPERRRDLPFFLALYDHLRGAPGVDEVTMNPVTGSVLLRFDERRRNTLLGTLADSPLIAIEPLSAIGLSNGRNGAEGGPVGRFLASAGGGAVDARAIVLVLMAGLAARQLMRGQLLTPAVTLALYGLDYVIRSIGAGDRGVHGKA